MNTDISWQGGGGRGEVIVHVIMNTAMMTMNTDHVDHEC